MVGLTVIAGLHPDSHIFSENDEAAVSRFIEGLYSTLENSMDSFLNLIPNDWDIMQERLRKEGVWIKEG